ncbi:MAG: SGNH/GDSL hydrolase family protein [bacterium]|nr:SGNH/GDSL hydrolase family protein [bacterium]
MTQQDSLPPVMQPTAKPRRRLSAVLGILFSVVFGVLLSWLMLEVLLRVGFDFLPAKTQADLQAVRRVPWSERAMVPPVPFISDRRLQSRLEPGLENYPVRWHDARFTFNTGTVWDGHMVGLRTDGPRYPLDILAFGDSFAFCWTAVEDCWVQRLESDYGWSATNAGMPGTGTTGQFRLMAEIAPPMQPRLIVWQWYTNDLFDDYVLALLNGESEPREAAPAPDPVPEVRGFARYSAVWRLIDVALNPPEKTSPYQHNQVVNVNGRDMLISTDEYTPSVSLDYDAVAYGWTRTLESLEAGHALADEIGAGMLLVLIPLKEEAYGDLLSDVYSPEHLAQMGESRRQLMQVCEERGWRCLDALPTFQKAIAEGETVYYALDFHLDASGNRLLAQMIQDTITQEGLLP